MFDPYNADWIIFLYRGNTESASSGKKSKSPVFRLFPNPTDGRFFIEGEMRFQKIEIYDLLGNKLGETAIYKTNNIDIGYLRDGIYLVKAVTQSGYQMIKVSIIH